MKSSLELMRSGVWHHGITDEIGAALMKAKKCALISTPYARQ